MDEIAIRVANLGKVYDIGSSRFDKSLKEGLSEILRISFRLLRFFFKDGYRHKNQDKTIWALRDVSFEVRRGEIVGIVGRNGSGKSTLLKILSRVTQPTAGEVEIRGRVGSLLEVGIGFHPELTGRENIYLSAAILGMKKEEIERKFDEIVAFSEIEKFLDTPVKHYSSGMYVRLAFSVAAHLELEVLLIDEVLAVGDLAFQKKCVEKITELIQQGRTVLYVSHSIPMVNRLCPRVLWLENGLLSGDGPCEEVLQAYVLQKYEPVSNVELASDSGKRMCLRKASLLNHEDVLSGHLKMDRPFRIQIEYDINKRVHGAHAICFVHTWEGINVLGSGDADCSPERLGEREVGSYRGSFDVPANLLGEGWYFVTVSLGIPFVEVYDRYENLLSFEISDPAKQEPKWDRRRRPGILGINVSWNVEKIN